MLKATATRVFFDNFPSAWTPTISYYEKGQFVWRDYLKVDYQYKEDALLVAKEEIKRLKEYGA